VIYHAQTLGRNELRPYKNFFNIPYKDFFTGLANKQKNDY
jgi:hypothetical protein